MALDEARIIQSFAKKEKKHDERKKARHWVLKSEFRRRKDMGLATKKITETREAAYNRN